MNASYQTTLDALQARRLALVRLSTEQRLALRSTTRAFADASTLPRTVLPLVVWCLLNRRGLARLAAGALLAVRVVRFLRGLR